MAKAPAFQLYAADFYMDTASWTATEVGAYFRLLMHEWVNGPLPADNAGRARISGIDPRNMQKMWSTVIAKKFITDDAGMYVNVRLENTRSEHNNYTKAQSEKGKSGAEKRWGKQIAGAMPTLKPEDSSSSSSSSLNLNPPIPPKKIKSISEPKIELVDSRFTNIPSALMNKWREVAPGIDIPSEIRKAELWLIAHPEKRRKRWEAFLSNWMVKAQDHFIKYGGNGNGRSVGGHRVQQPTEITQPAEWRGTDLSELSPEDQARFTQRQRAAS